MIKKSNSVKVIEYFSHTIEMKNGNTYNFRWKSYVLPYLTCGERESVVECLKIIPESLVIGQIGPDNIHSESISLEQFNQINAIEKINLQCNCHGFTFANGKFWINNKFVNQILKDEYDEVFSEKEIETGNFDAVCIYKDNEWIHSFKYRYDLYLHKEGLRYFSVDSSLKDLLSISEYSSGSVHYFRKKDRSCFGICLNAIGEKYEKSFSNEFYFPIQS